MGRTQTRAPLRSQTDGNNVTSLPHHTLPAGGTAAVAVDNTPAAVGGVRVTLRTAATNATAHATAPDAATTAAPAAVSVSVKDPATAKALGVRGVVMSLSRAATTGAGAVHASFDYSSFANAYGADYGDRLRLVALPACALTTPSVAACQEQTDLDSVNAGGAVSADLTVPANRASAATPAGDAAPATAPQLVVALTSSASSAGATFAATSLTPAYSWSAGTQGGTFATTYPLDTPDALGGPEPDLHLDYDSGSVDGQTLAQNGQASWVGEGWDLQTGFIEQNFRSCSLDGGTTGDLCEFSPYNATMVFQGQSVMLVRDKTSGVWHAASDSAIKVDQVLGTGAANAPGTNGTADHKYWRVTTQDGTQYFFGVNYRYAGDTAQTNAAQWEPVFGNNSGELCYNATFANAWCQVGYRWNLDYVKDTDGNSLTYVYSPFTGRVGINANHSDQPYVIQDTLDHIDYGTRAGSEATTAAPMRVAFGKVNRCTGACAQGTSDYPDTPWDLYCSSTTTCPNTQTPVFFDPYQLGSVTTQLLVSGTTYRNVDSWALGYQFPATGDYILPAGNDTAPNLWLASITHTGYAADGVTTMTEPAVTTGGTRMANRTQWGDSIGVAPYMHYRLTSLNNGQGGQTIVAYSGVPCTSAQADAIVADQNTLLCFPQYFKPQIAAAGWGWFNKYTVASVTQKDLTGGSPDETWSYAYTTAGSSTNTLWHHDYNETTTLAYRSWSQFNGFSTVTVTHGATGGPQTVTTSLYYRGMDGDGLSVSGQTTWNQRRVTITDSQGSGIVDEDGMQGRVLEVSQLDGTQINSSEVHTYAKTQTADRAAPATGGQEIYAYLVNETKELDRTWLPLSSTWRTSETDTTSNSYGLPTLVKDLGDTSTSSDDTCIATSYATADTTRWLINFPSQVVTTDCATTPGDADYLSGSQTFYDGSATLGATPTLGHPTRSTDLAWVTSGVQTWKQNDRIDYDSYGRESATYDSLDNQTIRQYVPATGGPVTQTKEFNPKGWGTYTNVEPGHGSITSTVDENSRTTSAAYDPLGRIVKVWANNRATSSTPDTQYSYGVSSTAPNWIETQKLGPTGAQVASYAIFDGQDRLRQNQDATPVANGGREISDTAYDSRGLKVRTSQFFNSTAAPGPTLATFADTDVPTQDRFTFDNLERETLDAFYSMGTQKWTDATSYQGDRMAETPPTGGITTQKMLDTDGKVTELRQFTSTNLSGSFTATDYTLDRLGNLTKVVDPAGNTWSWTYDLRGRVTQSTDPDSGTTSNTYDDNDQLLTSKDGRDVTIAYAYDNLGRKTDAYLGSTAGTHLDNWTYDTLAKGQLATQTQWQNGNPYITGVTSYDDAYRKLGVYVTLPTVEGSALAATWTTNYTYNPDGSVATTVYPAAGGLGSETVTNTYDANGFQLTAAGLDTYLSSAQYQPWGDVYKRFLGTGSSRVQVTTDEWADTHKARLLSVATEHPGTPNVFDEAFTQQYNWSGDEEITSIDSMHGGSVVDSQCFGYDYEQQLTTAFTTTSALGGCGATPSTSTVGGADPYWQTYTYDGSNNRTSLVSHGLAGVADTTSGYTYPAAATPKAHTLSGVSTTGPGAATANSYTYLGGGQLSNMTVGGRSTDFTYTSDGSVQSATIHATGGDQATTYLYDADGNEILRDTPTGKTLYLGHTDINTNATGSAITSVTRYYSVEDTVVASRNNPGTLSWLANDDQNTALVAVAQVGLAVAVRKEDPFGNARGAVPNWPNPRGFVGGTTEPDGLVHLGARMYDPTTGRFTSDDEVTDADNPEQINGYAYAYNSPLTYSDPDGRWGFKSFLHKVASVASVVSIIPGPIGSIAAGVAAVAYAGSGDWKNAAIMVAGIAAAAVGAGAAVLAAKVAIRGAKVVRTAAKAYQMSRKMAKVARLGRYGEKAARIVKNTRRIPSIVKGRYHIPDEIDDVRKIVHEVKNTKKLGYTRQIKSFHRYAKSKGYDFHISIRKGNGTRLSKPLQDLERRGEIVFRRIL